jgi:GH35 family endo-1,4-beta-xylanase
MLYARVSEEKVVLLHIGIAHDYASRGPRSDRQLTLKMVEQLKKVGRSIKGVTEIEILYGRRASAIRL